MLVFRGHLQEMVKVNQQFISIVGPEATTVASSALEDEDDTQKHQQSQKAKEIASARAQQLKLLYQTLDNLGKLLPESADRYIVREGITLKFWEVNSNTFKEKESVFIYVFNDAIAITTWKKNLITGKSKLVAERVWMLSEVGLIDVKDSPDIVNAFQIVKFPDTVMYRSETLEEKLSFLATIKTLTDQLFSKSNVKKLESNSVVKSVKNTNLPNLPGSLDQKNVEKDNLSPTDYRWLGDLSDELDVLIAHRDFDQAVSHVDRARGLLANSAETPRVIALRSTINERISLMCKLMTIDLASPVATKAQVQSDIDRLLRLGLGDYVHGFNTGKRYISHNQNKHNKMQSPSIKIQWGFG
jgi:hypothetical protein